MRVLVVDWLGRGGIAECTAAFLMEASQRGAEVHLVTRPGRWPAMGGTHLIEAPSRRSPIDAHREVVKRAAEAIRDLRPDRVVVQNYLLPFMERPAFSAARAVGASVTWIVHDHRLPSPLSGSRFGISALANRSDEVIAHSDFVARSVQRVCGRRVTRIPLPQPLRLLSTAASARAPFERPPGQLAVHFGVLKRRYKGSAAVVQIARRGVPGWSFVVLGVGAPNHPAITRVPRYVSGDELVASLRASDAVLLPYKRASQSGAVVLAQSLGLVAVASAVGGISEQIEHRRTGVLMPSGASVDDWCDVLRGLDSERVALIGGPAREVAESRHQEFAAWVGSLVGGSMAS